MPLCWNAPCTLTLARAAGFTLRRKFPRPLKKSIILYSAEYRKTSEIGIFDSDRPTSNDSGDQYASIRRRGIQCAVQYHTAGAASSLYIWMRHQGQKAWNHEIDSSLPHLSTSLRYGETSCNDLQSHNWWQCKGGLRRHGHSPVFLESLNRRYWSIRRKKSLQAFHGLFVNIPCHIFFFLIEFGHFSFIP